MKKHQKQFDLLFQSNFINLVKWAVKTTLFIAILLVFQACTVEGENNPANPIDKFLGTWNVSDQPARINYTVTIAKNPSQSTNVLLNNFADMGESANGLVVGNTIVIDKQDVGNDFLCNGTGTYKTSNRLEFEFILDDGIDQENRTAIFTK